MVVTVVPGPARVDPGRGRLRLGPATTIGVAGPRSVRLDAVARRLAAGLGGLPAPPAAGDDATIVLSTAAPGRGYPALGDDESYRLRVTDRGARIDAATPWGASHGVETLLQLVESGPGGFWIPAFDIRDEPRFAWRGLLLDVCRHWMPLPTVLRTVDVMAAVKLNVLHLHLTEDQAFRFACRAYPRLHQLGSGGAYFTQDELRIVVEHAADRGVRVVPEIDVPGHATSWLVGYPDLAATPGPFTLRPEFGISTAALDPHNERVDEVLDAVLGELAAVFPDEYVHTGGDEVDAASWPAIADAPTAQAAFTRRLAALCAAHGRRMVVWDEALSPDLPADVVVQAWRGPRALHEAVQAGHDAILSAGWYLDHLYAARHLLAVDPLASPAEIEAAHRAIEADPGVAPIRHILRGAHQLQGGPAGLAPLPAEAAARVLGGEACMWTELVTAENLDARLWPRTAAFAERLWAVATDGGDLTDRLGRLGPWLEQSAGSEHRTGRDSMLTAIAGPHAAALRVVSDALEPVKWYTRLFAGFPFPLASDPPDRCAGDRRYTTATPLDRLVDATPPESETARRLQALIPAAVDEPDGPAGDQLAALAAAWRAACADLAACADIRVAEVRPLLDDLAACADLVDEFLAAARADVPLAPARRARLDVLLTNAAVPCAELVLVAAAELQALLEVSDRAR